MKDATQCVCCTLFVCVALFFWGEKKEVELPFFGCDTYRHITAVSFLRSHAIVHNEWSLYGYIKVCALQIQEYIYNYVCVYLFYSTKQPLPFFLSLKNNNKYTRVYKFVRLLVFLPWWYFSLDDVLFFSVLTSVLIPSERRRTWSASLCSRYQPWLRPNRTKLRRWFSGRCSA